MVCYSHSPMIQLHDSFQASINVFRCVNFFAKWHSNSVFNNQEICNLRFNFLSWKCCDGKRVPHDSSLTVITLSRHSNNMRWMPFIILKNHLLTSIWRKMHNSCIHQILRSDSKRTTLLEFQVWPGRLRRFSGRWHSIFRIAVLCKKLQTIIV